MTRGLESRILGALGKPARRGAGGAPAAAGGKQAASRGNPHLYLSDQTRFS